MSVRFEIPSVHSFDLHTALEEIDPKLSAYQSTLDQISADIKAVEEYLVSRSINIPFEFELDCKLENPRIDEDEFDIEVSATAAHRELLLWEHSEKSGFRMIYSRTTQNDVILDRYGKRVPNANEGEIQVHERKPLIETKVAVRARVYSHLPKFLKALSSQIPEPTDRAGSLCDLCDEFDQKEAAVQ